MDNHLTCEWCNEGVPADDFEYLSENILYDLDNVFIMHISCLSHMHGTVKVLEQCGILALVQIEWFYE